MWVFKKANVIKYMQLPIGEKKKMEERKERREPKKKKFRGKGINNKKEIYRKKHYNVPSSLYMRRGLS